MGYFTGKFLMLFFGKAPKKIYDAARKFWLILAVGALIGSIIMIIVGIVNYTSDSKDYYRLHYDAPSFHKKWNGDYVFKQGGVSEVLSRTEFDIYGKGKSRIWLGLGCLVVSVGFARGINSVDNKEEYKLYNAAEKYVRENKIVIQSKCDKCRHSFVINRDIKSCPKCGLYASYLYDLSEYCKKNKLFKENKGLIEPYITDDEFGVFRTSEQERKLKKAAIKYVKDNYDTISGTCKSCGRLLMVDPRNPENMKTIACPQCGMHTRFDSHIMKKFIESENLLDKADLLLPYVGK